MKATSLKMEMSRMNIWVKARRPTQNTQGMMILVWELKLSASSAVSGRPWGLSEASIICRTMSGEFCATLRLIHIAGNPGKTRGFGQKVPGSSTPGRQPPDPWPLYLLSHYRQIRMTALFCKSLYSRWKAGTFDLHSLFVTLEGVGPADNRSSTNLLQGLEKKMKNVTPDNWHVIPVTWHLTCETWNVTNGGGWTFSQITAI